MLVSARVGSAALPAGAPSLLPLPALRAAKLSHQRQPASVPLPSFQSLADEDRFLEWSKCQPPPKQPLPGTPGAQPAQRPCATQGTCSGKVTRGTDGARAPHSASHYLVIHVLVGCLCLRVRLG